MNKTLTKSLYLTICLAIFSCGNPKKKNNEQEKSSSKIEISKESQENKLNDSLSLEIGNYLKTNFLTKSDLRVISKEERRFQFSKIDLNGDGVDEIFIYLNSKYFCGSGGCTFLLADSNMNLITRFTVTRPPILISKASENNWKKLYLFSDGGYRELIYNVKTKSYPANPSLVDKVKEDISNQGNIIKLFDSETQPNIYY